MIKNLNNKSFDEALSGSVIVDFYAEWCSPCRSMSRVLEDFDRAHPEMLIAKVNIDESPELAERYGVRSEPTIALLREGDVEKMNVGVMTMRALEEAVL